MAVAVVAIAAAYITRQRRVANLLRAEGAVIDYRYQYDNWDTERYSRNSDAELHSMLRFVGPDIGSTIVRVSSRGSRDPSRVANLCSKLPKLRLLAIQDCPLSDGDIECFTGLRELRGLYLRGTSITDDAVPTLRTLKHLNVLNVTETSLSDVAIEELRKSLPNTRVRSGPESGSMM